MSVGETSDVERTVWTMGTSLAVRVGTIDRTGDASHLAELAIREVENTEALISSWRPDSELSRISASGPGERVAPTSGLAALLDEAERWRERTGRAFDPHLGALVDAWGLREGGGIPSDADLDAAVEATRIGVTRRVEDGFVRTDAPTWFDAGGFGKGYALRRAADAVHEADSSARVELDFGGQFVRSVPVSSASVSDPTWVPVAGPTDRDRAAVQIRLPDVPTIAVATSGNSERGLEVDGTSVGHVLDPRTGRPADYAGSVTVIASDPMVADILSTALLVMGPDEGAPFVEALDGVDAVWQPSSGGVLTTLSSDAWRLGPSEGDPTVDLADSHTPARSAG